MREVDVGRADEGLLDAQDRTFLVEAAQLVAFARLGLELLEQRVEPGRSKNRACRWQVVEQCGRAVKEQRQVILDAAVGDTLGHLAVNARLRRLSLESLAVAVAKTANRIGIERHLARRQDVDRCEAFAGQLALGRKLSQ